MNAQVSSTTLWLSHRRAIDPNGVRQRPLEVTFAFRGPYRPLSESVCLWVTSVTEAPAEYTLRLIRDGDGDVTQQTL